MTANVRFMPNIPTRLHDGVSGLAVPELVEVRGEVYFPVAGVRGDQ